MIFYLFRRINRQFRVYEFAIAMPATANTPRAKILQLEVEVVELAIRDNIRSVVGGYLSLVSSHVLQRVNERVGRALKKNASMEAERYDRSE